MALLPPKWWQRLLLPLLFIACWLALPGEKQVAQPSLVLPDYASLPQHDQWQFAVASDMQSLLVHAASMVELPDGRLMAFWFAGSREGAKDVSINSATFDPRAASWSPERPILTRQQLIDMWGRHVRKLGNMVPVLDDDGSLRLFVVAVTFGGWAASRVVVLRSEDQGQTWQFDGELKTSPFFNISTLVKTPPVHYQDGSIGLPVYHELLGKFGQLLRLDDNNQMLSMSRIGYGRMAIQPLVLTVGPRQLVALMRPESEPRDNYVYRSSSADAGNHWSDLVRTGITTPSSALGGIALSASHWLLAGNCNRHERDDLCVRETIDAGAHWQRLWTLQDRADWRGETLTIDEFAGLLRQEFTQADSLDWRKLKAHLKANMCDESGCQFQYDYPYMLRTRNGDLHILYTWNKTLIRHAWLQADEHNEGARRD